VADLPFHCPRLKGDFLREPCTKKLEQIKGLTDKFNLPFLGPLEHCRACQGKELVKREAPSPQPSPTRGEGAKGPPAETPAPSGPAFKGESMAVKLSEAEARRLPPEVLERARPVEGEGASPAVKFCKKHPDVEQHKNTGLCLECLRARQASATAARKQPELRPLTDEAIKTGRKAVARLKTSFEAGKAVKLCAKHGKPIKFNRKGYSMGGCEECRKEISASGGAAADPMLRLFKGREELRTWIEAEAQRQVRTPEQQMVWCCLQAFEAATAPMQAGPQTA
jgi:hypothetical protein